MDFDFERADSRNCRTRCSEFLDEHVYPAEPVFHRAAAAGDTAAGDPFRTPGCWPG